MKWNIIFLFMVALIKTSPLSCDERLKIGRWTYGNPIVHYWEDKVHLRIGNFCSIAGGVNIMLAGEHRTDWVTTFPFNVLWSDAAGHIEGHPKTKGDVIIGNDVWIGQNACILSGVTIGDGAVIGSHALVAKNVPPYAIFAGNPAKLIRYRFDEETIKKLLAIAWWNWPDEEIRKVVDLLLSDNIQLFIEYCQRNGKISNEGI